MGRRNRKADDIEEFKVNPDFLTRLGIFYDQNKHRFQSGELEARQFLFEEGIRHVSDDEDGVMIPRALKQRKEFLDPQNRSIQIRVDNNTRKTLKELITIVTTLAVEEVCPVVLKIGYDAQP